MNNSTNQLSFGFVNNLNHVNRGAGIGAYAVQCLSEGWTPKETLAMVQTMFPLAETSMKCIYWYKSKNKQVIHEAREALANVECDSIVIE